jgi:hypothetical protein
MDFNQQIDQAKYNFSIWLEERAEQAKDEVFYSNIFTNRRSNHKDHASGITAVKDTSLSILDNPNLRNFLQYCHKPDTPPISIYSEITDKIIKTAQKIRNYTFKQ